MHAIMRSVLKSVKFIHPRRKPLHVYDSMNPVLLESSQPYNVSGFILIDGSNLILSE